MSVVPGAAGGAGGGQAGTGNNAGEYRWVPAAHHANASCRPYKWLLVADDDSCAAPGGSGPPREEGSGPTNQSFGKLVPPNDSGLRERGGQHEDSPPLCTDGDVGPMLLAAEALEGEAMKRDWDSKGASAPASLPTCRVQEMT